MRTTFTHLAVALTFCLALVGLSACDPERGQSCSHQGDTWAGHGIVLKCQPNHSGQLQWT